LELGHEGIERTNAFGGVPVGVPCFQIGKYTMNEIKIKIKK
jgi:hypothetical protein